MLGRWRRLRDRWGRTLTLGVRALVLSAESRVFLVKHGYARGWHFPGGGVERGESFVAALARELKEEGNIELTGPPVLHGLYFYPRYSNCDHVALFVVRAFRQGAAPRPNREIVDCGFFALGDLPAGTTAATRARIAEVLHGEPAADLW
ncbi:MAG: NUDIX domain-containing protein [Variibacter sp.]|nr:NUDIX domain-containing protein [Variibacter sp.]